MSAKILSGYSRRSVLRNALLLSTARLGMDAQTTKPHLHFPSAPQSRLAVTSYPFRAYIESPTNPGRDKAKPGMDLKQFPAMIAKRFHVYAINPLADHLSSTSAAYLDSFREAVAAAHSCLADLGLSGRDFSDSSKPVRDEAISFGRRGIDLAAAIGSPSVRQHLHASKDATPSVDQTAESLTKLAAYGAKRNVIVNLENDSPGAEDPFFIVKVIRKVDSPYLRALPDFGNSLRGHDAAYNHEAVAAMFDFAYNMSHVKNVLRTKNGEVDRVNVPGMFAVARGHAYRGYFSMEYDTAAGDPFEGTDRLIELSLKYM